MNRVEINCKKESMAKFYYASKRMAFELKVIRIITFLISIVPIVLSLIPFGEQKTVVFAATMVSFGFSIILELLSSFMVTHKEKGILLRQLYSAGITGCTFSKTEHDRELTNRLSELAIRKAEVKISMLKEFHVTNVPNEIDEKYAYLYICRTNAASNNFLMGRMFAFYIFSLALIVALFISFAFVKQNTFEFLQLIIQFTPLVLPVIRNINSCHKAMKYYTKISADIDNFFAEKNKASEKRSRFIAYIQGLEFEAMMQAPIKYIIFSKMFSGGLKKLNRGVTNRFLDSIELVEGRKITRLKPMPLKKQKKENEVKKAKVKTLTKTNSKKTKMKTPKSKNQKAKPAKKRK